MCQKAIEQDEVDAVTLDISGVKIQTLYTDDISGAMTVLMHIAAGATIPQQWHTSADEAVFVLSGDLIEQGRSYGPRSLLRRQGGDAKRTSRSRQKISHLSLAEFGCGLPNPMPTIFAGDGYTHES